MRKIPTLLVRDEQDRRYVTNEVTPGCEWVLAGEGAATRKYDGTCVMLDRDGDWWARREVKPGKTPPPNWVEVDRDETTGKRMGWEPIEQSSFAKFHAEALGNPYERRAEGTYELIGPKINGNPESREEHDLEPHDLAQSIWLPLRPSVEQIVHTVRLLDEEGIEGIVWHHPDGRMAKLKGRDLPTTPAPRDTHEPAAGSAAGGEA